MSSGIVHGFAGPGVDDFYRADAVKLAEMDIETNLRHAAVDVGIGGGGGGFEPGPAHLDDMAVDRRARRGVVIALGPKRVDQARQVGGGPPGQAFAILRRLLAQTIKIGGALQDCGEGVVRRNDFNGIGDGVRTRRRRLLRRAEKTEEPIRAGGAGERRRPKENSDQKGNAQPTHQPNSLTNAGSLARKQNEYYL